MAHPGPKLLPLALAVALALALASCGGGDAKLLSGNTAREITENLEAVRQLAAEGECVSAQDAAQEVSTEVEGLDEVDPKLKETLSEGAVHLNEAVASCEEVTTEEPVEETVPAPTETTPKPEKKEPKPKKEKPEPPEETEAEGPEEPEAPGLPPQANGKAKGHTETPGPEETPSGGIGPGTQAGEGDE